MAYDNTKLSQESPHGRTDIPKQWVYEAGSDTLAAVRASGYFNSDNDKLTVNDLIWVNAIDGAGWMRVNSNTGGVVDVDDPLQILPSIQKTFITGAIADVSSAGQIFLTAPVAGTVTKISTVLNGAIGTADAGLTVKDDAGSSMGTITIANSGSAAGDKDSLVPASNNVVAAGDNIEIETDGASTNAISVFVLVEITPTQDTD